MSKKAYLLGDGALVDSNLNRIPDPRDAGIAALREKVAALERERDAARDEVQRRAKENADLQDRLYSSGQSLATIAKGIAKDSADAALMAKALKQAPHSGICKAWMYSHGECDCWRSQHAEALRIAERSGK